MSLTAQITILLVTIVLTAWVVRLVGLRQLRSKYALLWLVVTLPLVPFAIFPTIVNRTADELGVNYQPALVFSLALLLLLGIAIYFSWELSRLEARSRILSEEVALLRSRLDELEADESGD